DHPERYIKEFAESGADLINFHLEATDRVSDTIAQIRALGKKVGITIKPGTPAEAVKPYLDKVDIKKHLCLFANRRDNRHSIGDRGDKQPIHHVNVQPTHARLFQFLNLLTQSPEVSR
ncbi:MAG: hypothetical protein IJ833_05355, partial [Lachnospiraceae bacterium]|nr:hypothetical protein [Lachnospiraceae bacterium]